jgi:serine protease Do
MKILSTLVVLSLLTLPVQLTASMAEWATIVARVEQSLVQLDGCSGFVINTERDLVLSALHCEGDAYTEIDGEPATVVFRDRKKDLMVLWLDGLDKPALRIATSNATLGSEVGSLGYGYSLEKPLFRTAHVSQVAVDPDASDFPRPVLAIDAAYVGGQSGGPVINTIGEVVGIVQFGTDRVGMGVEAKTLRDRLKKFLP